MARSTAFARARRFLNYHPTAQWSAIAAGVGAGILFVALLLVLFLYADLMVNKGEIPCYGSLAPREKAALQDYLRAETSEDRAAREKKFHEVIRQRWEQSVPAELAGFHGIALDSQLGGNPRYEPEWDLVWFLTLPELISQEVGGDAGREVGRHIEEHVKKYGLRTAVQKNLEDVGVMSLVVRARSSSQANLINPLVSLNSWTWAYGNTAYLLGLLIAALVLGLARVASIYVGDTMAAKAVIEATTRLRRALYHHTYRLGTLGVRGLGPLEAVSVSTRHLAVVHDGLFAWLTVRFRESVKFGLILAFALMVNFWLALAFLLFAFLVWVIGGQIAAHFRRLGRLAEERSANQLTLLQESLMLMRLVKVYLMEAFNQARVERQLARLGEAQYQRYRGEAIYRPVFALLGLLAAATLLWVAGFVVLSGHLGVTSAMVMITALVCLYWPVVRFLQARRQLRRGQQSAQALFEFLDRPGDVGQVMEAALLPPLARRLELDNITLYEPGSQKKLLDEVSLSIRAGQKVALVGPDENEKHALVYLVPRFLDPAAGEIRIDGKNLRWVTFDSLRTQIGMVLAHNLVFNDTVANNIGCGEPSCPLPKIIEAAKLAHAHQFIQKLPQGYETSVGDLGHALSSSEQYRIALARALLRDPALLIIEEPLTPVNDDTKSLIDDTLARSLPGKTVLFLAHRLSTIRNCDQVFLLHQGKIEAAGDHRDLLANNDLYRHLQYLEFNEFAGMMTPSPVPSAAQEE